MLVLSLTAASSLAFVIALHPFTTYPLSLYLMRVLRGGLAHKRSTLVAGAGAVPPAPEPSFALCMSVFNEEICIVEKISNMFAVAATVKDCRIYVYADRPSDRTVALLQTYADRIVLVVGSERRGKTYGLNQLMRRVTADVVVFTDANVTIEPGALNLIGRHFSDPTVGCVCGHLIYVNDHETTTSLSGAVYWRIEEAIKQLESDTYSVIGADGSLFAIRRELHRPPPDDIIDDFYVSMMIVCEGYRAIREPTARAFERSATGANDEFRRKVRIACQAFNVHRLIWPRLRHDWRLAYYYLSHRFLKWLTIYSIAVGIVLMLTALAVAFSLQSVAILSLCVALTLITLAAAGSKPVQQGFSILLAFTGVGVGVWRSLCGDRYQVWDPVLSSRDHVMD